MAKQGSFCELCSAEAKMFCDSDQASLCWDCDDKVHAANFLVAKHTRTALCHVCHSPTLWKASGTKIGRAVSVCAACVDRSAGAGPRFSGNGVGVDRVADKEEGGARRRNVRIAEESDDDSEGSDDDDNENGDDGDDFSCCDDDDDDNQVVPWTSRPPPPASATSTSCSEEEESFSGAGCESVSTSRFRDLALLFRSNDKTGVRASSSSSMATGSRVAAAEEEEEENLRGRLARPWKLRRVAMQP